MFPKPSRSVFVYVSGAITPTHYNPSHSVNCQRLSDVSFQLFDKGYSVYCPKVVWFKDSGAYDADWDAIIEMDMEIITRCDAMYMLRGWQYSRGAVMEYDRAKSLNLSIKEE